MELDLDRLATQGLVLAFERPFGRHKVVVGPSGGVSGQIASDAEGTFVEARTPDVLVLKEVVWQLKAGAVKVEAELDLHEVAVELSIPRKAPTHGKVQIGRAHSEDVCLEHARLGGEITAQNAALRGLSIVIDEGETVIAVEEARFSRLSIPIAGERVTFDDLVLGGLEVRVPKSGGWSARVREIHAGALDIPLGETQLSVEALAFREGASLAADGIRAALVGAAVIRLSVAGLLERDRKNAKPNERKSARKRDGARLDLGFLDRLRGHIHVDLVTDLRLPILRARRATHAIRLDVRDGMIRYDHLEKGLARLEDAVLDFAIRKGRLVLEKDIPLVPFDRKTLVSWALDGDERRLAESGWVRLSRLAEPRVEIETKPKKPGDGDGMVREIRADDIDVALSLGAHPGLALPGGTTLRLGGDGAKTAFERLRLRGRVVYRPNGSDEIHALEAEGERILLGLDALPLGPRRATVRSLLVEKMPATRLHLRGLEAAALESHLEGVELRDVFITPPTS